MADPNGAGLAPPAAAAAPSVPNSQPSYQVQQPYPAAAAFPAAQQYAQPYPQYQQPPQQQPLAHPYADQLRTFWEGQKQEVSQVGGDPAEFKNHQLPLARIKKIMKSDEDVRMISAEAPVLFAKACEMFILELTLRSWIHAEENKRRTLQRNDIAAAITKTDIFDFLVDIVPRDEQTKPEGPEPAGVQPRPPGAVPPTPVNPGMYYPYPGMPGPVSAPEHMMAALPSMPMDPALMYQQSAAYMGMAGQQWPQPQMQAAIPGQPPPSDASSQQ
eukprot:jgi/Chrzof1/14625/Cz09g09270.t1